jgi:hypothetical protein
MQLTSRPVTIQQPYFINGVLQPQPLNLSLDPVDSPIIFTFESDPIPNAQTGRAVVLLTLGYNFIANTNFLVPDLATYQIYGEIFTARPNPGQIGPNEFFSFFANGNLTPLPTGPQTLIMAQSLADAINRNTNLNWRFEAVVAQIGISGFFGVRLRARFEGSIYQLQPAQVSASGFLYLDPLNNPTGNQLPILYSTQIDDENVGQAMQEFNYACWVDIIATEAPVQFGRLSPLPFETKIGELVLNWNSSNKFQFEISRYLKAKLSYFTPDLADDYTFFKLAPNQLVSYYLRYGEAYTGGYDVINNQPLKDPDNITFSKYSSFNSELRWATWGLYPLNANPANNTKYWVTRDQGINFNLSFLTTQPTHLLRRRQPEKPWYESILLYNNQQFSSLRQWRIQYQHTLLDGTQLTPQFVATTSQNISGIYYIDLAETQLNLLFFENNFGQVLTTEVFVQVFLNGQWQRYSRSQFYVWDTVDNKAKYSRLYWRNSLGQISQFDFEGQSIQNLNRTEISYQSSLSRDNGVFVDQGQRQTLLIELNRQQTANSGWVDEATYQWLTELAATNDIWIYSTIEYTEPDPVLNFAQVTRLKPVLKKIFINDFNWQYNNQDRLWNLELSWTESTEINTRSR